MDDTLLLQWEKIIVVILAVVGGVLVIHLILELATKQYKLWKRQKSQQDSSKVQFIRRSRASKRQEEGSEEDTDAGETSRLIFLMEERTEQSNCQDKTSTRTSAIIEDESVRKEGKSSEELFAAGSVRVEGGKPDSEWLSYRGEDMLSSFEGGKDKTVEERCYGGREEEVVAVNECEEVRISMDEGREDEGREGSDGGVWSPIYRDTDMLSVEVREGGAVRGDWSDVTGDGAAAQVDSVSCGEGIEEDLIDVDLVAVIETSPPHSEART